MSERTEEEKITQAGIKVILGGKEYEVRPLVIRDAREWRKKVIALIAPIPSLAKVSTDTPEDFGKALTTLLVTMPDQVLDLFFEYARDLDRSSIEGIATDAELAVAFQEVIAIAFPLAQSAPDVVTRLYGKNQTKKKHSQ